MAQTTLETNAASQYTILLKLVYGSTTKRYARWTDDVVVGADTYTAVGVDNENNHLLAFEFGVNHGGLQDKASIIRCPDSLVPFALLSTGRAHAPVHATVYEVDPTSTSATLRELFYGTVKSINREDLGLLKVTVEGIKASLQNVVLGAPALTTCIWWLGHPTGCKVDRDALNVTAEVTGLQTDSKINRISVDSTNFSFTSAAEVENARYARGWVEYDGLRLMIRQLVSYGSGTAKFELTRQAPENWLNEDVLFVQGCDKRIETCRIVYENEENFAGFGYAIPDRNPIFES